MMDWPAFAEVMKLGPQGVLLIFMTGVAAELLRRLVVNFNARVSDWKELAELVKQHALAEAAMTASNEARTRAAEALARVQELSAAAQTALANENAQLRVSVAELRNEVQRLREVILQKERV